MIQSTCLRRGVGGFMLFTYWSSSGLRVGGVDIASPSQGKYGI